jgi:RHS repeat-associated protein
VANTGSGGASYSYDNNGNMTSREGQTIGWSSFNYPTYLSTATENTTFTYGPDRQYYRQDYSGPGVAETTYYIGGILEKVYDGTTTDWRHSIVAEGRTVAIVSYKSSGGGPTVNYPLGDGQGSGSTLTNNSGGVVVRQSYTAYGLPRDGDDWDGAESSGDLTTMEGISRRGYTGHSMLGRMGLIHMNGRVQDAVTGRFLSPDPNVFNPGFTQSYNRYAYVNNNPMTYLDPSGFCATGDTDTTRCPVLDEVLVTNTRLTGSSGLNALLHALDELSRSFYMRCGASLASSSGGCIEEQEGLGMLESLVYDETEALRSQGPLDYSCSAQCQARKTQLTAARHDAVNNLRQEPQSPSLLQKISNWWKGFIGSGQKLDENGLTARESLEMQRFYAYATGSVVYASSEGVVRVGRFMSPNELAAMRSSGLVQESWNGGVTSVSLPANPGTYRAAPTGDVYVEFDVPASAIRAADGSTGKIYSPNSIPGRALGVTELPPATRIVIPRLPIP